MSALTYRGRNPNSDFSLVHKKYIDGLYGQGQVDLTYINQTVAHEVVLSDLATEIYVNQQDAKLPQRTTVDVADNNYLLRSDLGKPNGLAQLGPDTYVPGDSTGSGTSGQLPALKTKRKAFFKNADFLALTGTQTRELNTVNPRDFELGTLTIPDLGFLYIPLLFATVTGGSVAGTNSTAALGTGNFAQLTVQRSSDLTKYAYALTSSQKHYETRTVMPTADPLGSPTPLSGENTFTLWAGLDKGTTYTLSAVALSFFAVCLPGL